MNDVSSRVDLKTQNSAPDVLPLSEKIFATKNPRSYPFYRSVTLAALGVFAAVNLCAQYSIGRFVFDRFPFQNRDSCWWAANNYRALKKAPDILLVGSSLMCRVVNEGDATYLKHNLNAGEHYRSEHLERVLSSPEKTYSTASLAVGGMNASDVGSLIPPLIAGDKKPQAIIYGIGPRDLFDNSLMSPSDAPGFRLAEKLTDITPDVMAIARHSREAQFKHTLNTFLRAIIPIYNFQDELSILFRRGSKLAIDGALPRVVDTDTIYAFSQIQMTALNLLPIDTPNNCIVTPDDPLHPDRFDFRNNYYMSYNPFKPALYRRQVFFLGRFLKYCHDQGIKTIVLKMPLRSDNYKLMPPFFNELYNNDIERLALANGALVIDAAGSNYLNDNDFTDTVHMSGSGSCKLVEAIGPIVKKYLELK